MNKEVKERWVKALRSGEYKQGRGCLRSEGGDGAPDEFCCLGVLADVIGPDAWEKKGGHCYSYLTSTGGFLPSDVATSVGLPSREPHGIPSQNELASKNDSGYTFEEIADYIEENL